MIGARVTTAKRLKWYLVSTQMKYAQVINRKLGLD